MAIKSVDRALTVADVAALTGFSRDTITRMFQHEPGVLVLARPSANHKRRYRSIRIPRAVYERVVRRLTV
jgi:transcriptional regulator GlxA family with amidase domain